MVFRCLAVFLAVAPAAAWANGGDIAEALSFAKEISPDFLEGIDWLDQYQDYDPNEALGVLLDQEAPKDVNRPARPYFDSLGGERLSYEKLKDVVDAAAARAGLPVALIDAVIRTESGYRSQAISRVGAMGLMQLMPATARSLGVTDPFDPRQNVMGGAMYLRRMYDRFGSMPLAIAAYNAGPGSVAKHGGIPPFKETRRYVATVLKRYEGSTLRK